MKKVKVKMIANVIAQAHAGTEVDCIVDGGTIYIPSMDLSAVFSLSEVAQPAPKPTKIEEAETEEEEEETPAPKKSKSKAAPAPVQETASGISKETQKLLSLSPKELEKKLMELKPKPMNDLIEELQIEVPAEGKNTNKKLRDLVLAFQAEQSGEAEESEEDEEEEETEEVEETESDEDEDDEDEDDEEEAEEDEDTVESQVTAVMSKLDEGKITDAAALKKLTEIADVTKEQKANIKSLIEKFGKNDKITVAKVTKDITRVLEEAAEEVEEEEEEVEEAPKAKKKAKAEPKEELVDASDLSVGDEVSVYWTKLKDWFNGKVSKVSKGVVTVKYEDGASEIIDAKQHTKIKLIG
jgi:hypothetical protein